MTTPTVSTKQVISFIWSMMRPFPGAVFIMVAVALYWAIDMSLRPYFLKLILNGVADPVSPDLFSHIATPVLAYLFMIFLLSTFFRFYDYFVTIHMIPNMRRNIANANSEKLLEHSHHYYQNQFSGSLANKIKDLSGSIPELVQIVTDRFLATFLSLIVAVFVLWQVDARFAFATLIWSSSLILGAFLLSKRLSHQSAIWSEWGSTITGRLVDVLSNNLSVRLFARKSKEEAYLDESFLEATQAEQRLNWTYFWMWFFYGYTFFIVLAVNLYFLIKGRQEGWVTVGDFALVLAINISIVDFLWQIMREFSNFTKLFGRVRQALETIMAPVDLTNNPHAKILDLYNGGKGGSEITFEKVEFAYKGSLSLFDNKSITIKRGEKVGLVGSSGGGKTTFVNLILRLYDVMDGRILIDGQNIRDVTQDSLHEAIGMIPQDPSLFHRSLMDNIRYGLSEATDEQVYEAARKAHAHDFIINLPQGYDSLVGERGVKLSGGQRQRIVIARAILKNAPIFILDEATSELDSVTEKDIQDSLWELMQGKTTIVIAHRLSTLLHMDRILVFDQGKIVEDGSHAQLLAKGGLYKTLWDAQVGGFLPNGAEEDEEDKK